MDGDPKIPGEEHRPTASTSNAEPRERLPLDRIGRYRIKRQIGVGGMVAVYEAVQDSRAGSSP